MKKMKIIFRQPQPSSEEINRLLHMWQKGQLSKRMPIQHSSQPKNANHHSHNHNNNHHANFVIEDDENEIYS